MRRSRAGVTAATFLLVVAAGCTSDDGASPSTTADTAPTTDPAPTTQTSITPTTASATTAPTTTVDNGGSAPSTSPDQPVATSPTSVGVTLAPTTAPPPSTSEAPATPTTQNPDPAVRGDIQLAESALIDLSSLPPDWTGEPHTEAPDNEEFERRFDACFGRTEDSPTEVLTDRTADSDDFSGPGDERPSVEHSVSMAPDEQIALLAMAEVASAGASECLSSVVQEFFEAEFAADADIPDGLTLGVVTVERTDDGSQPDTQVGFRLEVPLMLDDLTLSQYLDVHYQRSGRALSNLQTTSFSVPFDAALIESLRAEVEVDLARIG